MTKLHDSRLTIVCMLRRCFETAAGWLCCDSREQVLVGGGSHTAESPLNILDRDKYSLYVYPVRGGRIRIDIDGRTV